MNNICLHFFKFETSYPVEQFINIKLKVILYGSYINFTLTHVFYSNERSSQNILYECDILWKRL